MRFFLLIFALVIFGLNSAQGFLAENFQFAALNAGLMLTVMGLLAGND